MRLLIRYFYLTGIIVVTFFANTHTKQKKMTRFLQVNKEEAQVGEKKQLKDETVNQIMCDEDDEEMCEYIEQQYKESPLKLWFYDVGITVMVKFIQLKEYLHKCKGKFDALVIKLLCSRKKSRS